MQCVWVMGLLYWLPEEWEELLHGLDGYTLVVFLKFSL